MEKLVSLSVKAVQSKGTVYICSLSRMNKVPKENNFFFLTTRGKRNIDGVRSTPELAPSPSLFKQYLNHWKGKPSNEWWDKYYEIYSNDLDQDFIDKIKVGLDSGKNVTLMCFCGDESICHRSILKEQFKDDYNVVSY